jgi:hypothetical protein
MTMSGLATVTNVPASMVTRHGPSCIHPSATSLPSVLVQELVLPSFSNFQLGFDAVVRLGTHYFLISSWPACMSFWSSLKYLITNCSVFFYYESHFWNQFVTYWGFYTRWKFISIPNSTRYS